MRQYLRCLKFRSFHRIPPNYRGVVYCMALKMDGTEFTYNFLWKEYKESNVMANKLVILNSMACSQNMNILKK